MSTARQVVPLYFVTPATDTGPALRAAVVRPSLRPSVPGQWWWGSASSALFSGTAKASAQPPAAPGSQPAASPCSGCGS